MVQDIQDWEVDQDIQDLEVDQDIQAMDNLATQLMELKVTEVLEVMEDSIPTVKEVIVFHMGADLVMMVAIAAADIIHNNNNTMPCPKKSIMSQKFIIITKYIQSLSKNHTPLTSLIQLLYQSHNPTPFKYQSHNQSLCQS